jgi:hypothetical protein
MQAELETLPSGALNAALHRTERRSFSAGGNGMPSDQRTCDEAEVGEVIRQYRALRFAFDSAHGHAQPLDPDRARRIFGRSAVPSDARSWLLDVEKCFTAVNRQLTHSKPRHQKADRYLIARYGEHMTLRNIAEGSCSPLWWVKIMIETGTTLMAEQIRRRLSEYKKAA